MIEDKIKTQIQLKKILDNLKKKKKRIVLTNGCFDILHYGHVRYLEEAKSKGDCLVVCLNSDESVRKVKGEKRPFIDQNDRAHLLAALESVDYVTIFDEETPLEIVRKLLPDILIKGGDWKKNEIIGSDVVMKAGGKVLTIPFVEGRSSSGIIDKIRNTAV